MLTVYMKRFILRFLGWTALLDVPLFFGGLLFLLIFKAYIRENPEEPYFELFLLTLIYQEHDDPYRDFVSNPSPSEKLDIEWIVNEDDLRSLKDPRMKIVNHGGAFYAEASGRNNFWIHAIFLTYRGDEIDTTSDGMRCGTGKIYQPILASEIINYTWFHSLFDKINTPFYSEREESINVGIAIDALFGDSTEIFWELTTFSVPWSSYVPQVVESPSFMLYPDQLKAIWKDRVGTAYAGPNVIYPENSFY
jgi:hypothetical protein